MRRHIGQHRVRRLCGGGESGRGLRLIDGREGGATGSAVTGVLEWEADGTVVA